jgi:hypothetical protein
MNPKSLYMFYLNSIDRRHFILLGLDKYAVIEQVDNDIIFSNPYRVRVI